MSQPILDPSLPADNSPLSSGQMRAQFAGIQNRFDNMSNVQPLSLTASDPPTRAEVQALADKLDEIVFAMQAV